MGLHSPLLWLNEVAYRGGLLPGMQLRVARSRLEDLRAGVVRAAEVKGVEEEVVESLRAFSPNH